MGSFSIWHWLIVLVIVVLVFGTRKLGNIGKDLGAAVRGFKEGMKDGKEEPSSPKVAEKEITEKEINIKEVKGRGRIFDHETDTTQHDKHHDKR